MQRRRVNDAGSYHVTASSAMGRQTQQRTLKPGHLAGTSPVFEFTICLSPRKSSATAPRSSADSAVNLLRHLESNSDESKRGACALPPHSHSRKASNDSLSPVNRVKAGAKEVVRKYLKKVKPLCEKFSISQKQHHQQNFSGPASSNHESTTSVNWSKENLNDRKSFSGNFRYPRSRITSSCISSSTSSMVPSPRHGRSGSGSGYGLTNTGRVGTLVKNSDASSMEEVQLAIQGAIAHCKNSMSKV